MLLAPDKTPNKIRVRNNITIGTWNVRTLHAVGKMEALEHEMERYHWNILGLSETRWKNQVETTTNAGHMFYYSGKDGRHEHGVGVLMHKDTVNSVMGCRPVSSRIIAISMRASPFNITSIQAYAPTSDYDDTEIEVFYEQLQEVLDETPKKDILIVQGDWNAKVGEDATKDWKGICGPYSNSQTNERGILLLEFASYNDLFLTNTFGPHKPSRWWTWHSPNGKTHNQIDYIMVKKRFRSSVNINRIRSFPGADVGSDHELLMMTFRLRLKKIITPTNTRIKYDLEKLKDPRVAKAFQAKIGGKFAPLILLENENNDIDNMVTAMNIAAIPA